MGEERPQPAAVSMPWRAASATVIGLTGTLSRAFLLAGNRLEVRGLERFLELLDERGDVEARRRGLITVSNHLSILDDPLMWGALPLKYQWSPDNMRWALGSHDLVFRNKPLSIFFALGQVFPTHRLAHSKHGGLFQPTVTQVIRLLSSKPFGDEAKADTHPQHTPDPFSEAQLTYTTNGEDSFHAPAEYQNRRHGWVHVFPEGKIHQRPDKTMRYFRWGVARMILESEPCPDVVPIWIEGFEQVMHESRKFPRPVPRPGKDISVTFGERVDTEAVFGDLRERWKKLSGEEEGRALGVLSDELKYSKEAVELREECSFRVREEVLKLRRGRGWPEEDPKARLADTWRQEGNIPKREGRMEDGSWIKEQ